MTAKWMSMTWLIAIAVAIGVSGCTDAKPAESSMSPMSGEAHKDITGENVHRRDCPESTHETSDKKLGAETLWTVGYILTGDAPHPVCEIIVFATSTDLGSSPCSATAQETFAAVEISMRCYGPSITRRTPFRPFATVSLVRPLANRRLVDQNGVAQKIP